MLGPDRPHLLVAGELAALGLFERFRERGLLLRRELVDVALVVIGEAEQDAGVFVLLTSSRRGPVAPLESSRPRAQIPDAVRFPDRVSPCPIMSVSILPAEPLPARVALSYVVGQDCRGRWVAWESHGLGGGYFRSREAAIRYAAAESGCRAGAVRLSPEPLAILL